jgi:hypothetical protein
MKHLTAFSFSLILSLGVFIPGCETFCGKCYCDNYDAQELPLNENFEMKFGETYCNPEHRFRLNIDSIQDGRCPIGVYCIWEGNARVYLNLEEKKEGNSKFFLNTVNGFLHDTTIHGIRFELIGLDPYPDIDFDYPQEVYVATMLISE